MLKTQKELKPIKSGRLFRWPTAAPAHRKAGPPMIAESIVVEDTAVAASIHWPWTVGLKVSRFGLLEKTVPKRTIQIVGWLMDESFSLQALLWCEIWYLIFHYHPKQQAQEPKSWLLPSLKKKRIDQASEGKGGIQRITCFRTDCFGNGPIFHTDHIDHFVSLGGACHPCLSLSLRPGRMSHRAPTRL